MKKRWLVVAMSDSASADAVSQAILMVKGVETVTSGDEFVDRGLAAALGEKPDALSRHVESLDLSVRARRTLDRLGIYTVGELVTWSPAKLLATENFGQTTLNELTGTLGQLGLKLAGGDSCSLTRGLDDRRLDDASRFPWSPSALKFFSRFTILTVSDLTSWSRERLLLHGSEVVNEIETRLRFVGLSLASDGPRSVADAVEVTPAS